jgi:hypothetical protein
MKINEHIKEYSLSYEKRKLKEVRSEFMKFRISEEEKKQLSSVFSELGVTPSQFFRGLLSFYHKNQQ